MLTTHKAVPQKLPLCKYPAAVDIEIHGLQPLPAELPVIAIQFNNTVVHN